MLGKTAVGLALALAFAPLVAMAERPYVDIEQRLTAEQLREVGLSPAQLDLLNAMLREASAKTALDEGPPIEDGQGRASLIGFNDEPIKSRLKHDVSGWEPGTVFELENGQRWKVLKGSMKLRKALQAPEILVVPGIAGRWFLQVDEDMPKARVYRID
ncbi:MAG: hypothetical protein H7Y19_10720 [Luteimonas sp.]|nr:hypothetical protein [Luteimonas sp.]